MGKFLLGQAAWIVAALACITLLVGPVPPYPGCKPVCVIEKASGDSCIAIELQREQWIGSACNSVETYPERVLQWWMPTSRADESFIVRIVISVFALSAVLFFAMLATIQSGLRLQAFSDNDEDVFEKRGAPPESWYGLMGSWKKVIGKWLEKSQEVWRDILTMLFAGYVVPSVLLVIFIVFSPLFLDGTAFIPSGEEHRQQHVVLVPALDALTYVAYQFSSAALYGMPGAFGWEGSDLRHDTSSLAVSAIAWLFSLYVSVLGNFSLLRTILVLISNLARPLWFKWSKFRDYVRDQREREMDRTAVAA